MVEPKVFEDVGVQDAERADDGSRAGGRLEDDARGAARKVHGQRGLVLERVACAAAAAGTAHE